MIRRLQTNDLGAALRLTQAENWSHRLADWEFHFALGRGWGACDANGALVGTALWWAYGESFGTVGLVVVDRSQQGQGLGRRLMDTVIEDAGRRALQLVATNAGLSLYRRCGFEETGAIEQRQGVPKRIAVAVPHGMSLRAATTDDVDALAGLDAAALGAERAHVIRAVLAAGSGVVAIERGAPTGFALLRASGRGLVIGPIVAGNETIATVLISSLLEQCEGLTRIDLPADATSVGQWLDSVGLVCVDRVTTMVRGPRPRPLQEVRSFGLVSQALS